MKVKLQSKPGDKDRLLVPVTGFSFESYPIHITHDFRCVSGAKMSQTGSHNRQQSVLGETCNDHPCASHDKVA